jgi:hypothetical protein
MTKYEDALKDLDTALQLLANSGFTDAKDIRVFGISCG